MPLGFSSAFDLPQALSLEVVLFGRHKLLIVKRRVHRVPRQRSALHANRELTHAGEYFQVAKTIIRILFIQFTGDHAVKLGEELLRFLFALALHRLGHHAGSGFGNRTPGAFEAYFLNRFVFQIQIDSQMIAAEWIETLGRVVGRLELAKIPRLLIVIENDLLVELA